MSFEFQASGRGSALLTAFALAVGICMLHAGTASANPASTTAQTSKATVEQSSASETQVVEAEIDGVTVTLAFDSTESYTVFKEKGWFSQLVARVRDAMGVVGDVLGGSGSPGTSNECSVELTVTIEGGSSESVNVNTGNVTCGQGNESGNSSSGGTKKE